MAAVALSFLLLALWMVTIPVSGRLLGLSSADDRELISDGANHVKGNLQLPVPGSSGSCNHMYGFLPCAENAAGFAFQILVYQGLLMEGEKQVGIGSKLLFNIHGVGKIGGIVFQILMTLPPMIIMMGSGVFSSNENAETLVSLGMGIFTGITVFILTVQWGVCVIYGGRYLDSKPHKRDPGAGTGLTSLFPDTEPLRIIKEKGVFVDEETRSISRIMLLSLIPYIVVQFVNIFNTSGQKRVMTWITLIVSSLSLISYFIYQILTPEIQKRTLEYSSYEVLQAGFLLEAKQLFSMIDKDGDRSITRDEMESYLHRIIKEKNMQVDDGAIVSEILKRFNLDAGNSRVTMKDLSERHKDLKNNSVNYGAGSGIIVRELLHQLGDGKPRLQRVQSCLKRLDSHRYRSTAPSEYEPLISPLITPARKEALKRLDSQRYRSTAPSEHEPLISPVRKEAIKSRCLNKIEIPKDSDEDDDKTINEEEFVKRLNEWIRESIHAPKPLQSIECSVGTTKLTITSVIRVIAGFVVLTSMGGPLVVSILQLSLTMNVPSFIISFVIVPLAMNVRAVITAIWTASEKNQRTASLTFSEIYGVVIMNNIAGLTIMLAIVCAKGLTWNFSAEVIVATFVCAVMGILACSRTTYRLWTCILSFSLYPSSLGLFYFVHVVLHWN